MIGHGKKVEKLQPNNLLITLIGGIFVWIGWYGFNTGSAFTLNDIAVISFVNTIIAASGGAFSWLILEYFSNKKLSLLGLLSCVLSTRNHYTSSWICKLLKCIHYLYDWWYSMLFCGQFYKRKIKI